MKDEKQKLYDCLYDIVGEAGCGVSCTEAEIYLEAGEWNLFLEGFMAPWPLGKTVEEAVDSLKDYASQGFGLS